MLAAARWSCRVKSSLFSCRCPALSAPPVLRAMSSSFFSAAPSTSFTVPTIQLDNQESAVLNLIDDFTKHLASTRNDLPAVECRVAGGWVRDKVCVLAAYLYRCPDSNIAAYTLAAARLRFRRPRYLYLVIDRPSLRYPARGVPSRTATPSCYLDFSLDFSAASSLDAKHQNSENTSES